MVWKSLRMRGFGAAVRPCFELFREPGLPDFDAVSRTTINLPDSAFRSQIGKWRWAASSEKKREQWGHCLRLSRCRCAYFSTPETSYWLVLSVADLDIALRNCSLSCFHLGTLLLLMGLLSILSLFCTKGGLAEAMRGLRTGLKLFKLCFPLASGWDEKVVKSIILGIWEVCAVWTTNYWQVSMCWARSFNRICLRHFSHCRIWEISSFRPYMSPKLTSWTLKLDWSPIERI